MSTRLKTTRFKIQAVGLDDRGRALIDGHAAVFNNVDRDNEVILPGAFKQFIGMGGQLPIYYSHAWALNNPAALPIGKTRALQEDDEGLYFKAVLGNTRDGQDVAELMDIGAIQGASFGFDALPGGEETRAGVTYLTALWPKEISVAALHMVNPRASAQLLARSDDQPSAALSASDDELFAAVLRGFEQSLREG